MASTSADPTPAPSITMLGVEAVTERSDATSDSSVSEQLQQLSPSPPDDESMMDQDSGARASPAKDRVTVYFDVLAPHSYIALETWTRYEPVWDLDLLFVPVCLQYIMVMASNQGPPSVANKHRYNEIDLPRQAKASGLVINMPSDFPFKTWHIQGFLLHIYQSRRELLRPLMRLFFRAIFSCGIMLPSRGHVQHFILSVLGRNVGVADEQQPSGEVQGQGQGHGRESFVAPAELPLRERFASDREALQAALDQHGPLSEADLQAMVDRGDSEEMQAELLAQAERLAEDDCAFGVPWIITERISDGVSTSWFGTDRVENMAAFLRKPYMGAFANGKVVPL